LAAVITYDDVVNGFATTVSEEEINLLIEIVDEADLCLDGAGVSESKQKILKIYAVRHMCWMQANGGKGNLTSQHAASGASQSWSAWKGVGVNASPYGASLSQLDSSGCIVGLIESGGSYLSIMSVGRQVCE